MPFILTIPVVNPSRSARSPVRSKHATAEKANSALAEYVARNWDAEIGTDRPKDPGRLVDDYFLEARSLHH